MWDWASQAFQDGNVVLAVAPAPRFRQTRFMVQSVLRGACQSLARCSPTEERRMEALAGMRRGLDRHIGMAGSTPHLHQQVKQQKRRASWSTNDDCASTINDILTTAINS